jgi:hypothetical protein
MNGFIYYVPNAKGVRVEDLTRLGIGYASEGEGPTSLEVFNNGPDGGQGCFATFGDQGFNGLDKIEWMAMTPGQVNGVLVGLHPDYRPGPADLVRKRLLQGHEVTLSDGNNWLVPVARQFGGSSPLPTSLRWDGSAWVPGDVLKSYQELFGKACRIWDVLCNHQPGEDISISDGAEIAVSALGLNYRIGRCEVSLLGLMDTRCLFEVLKMVVDWPTFEKVIKKNAELSESTPAQ